MMSVCAHDGSPIMIDEYKISYWARNFIIVAKTQKSMLIRRLFIDGAKVEKERRVASKTTANRSCKAVSNFFQMLKNTTISR
jgi:hypothetical protein